MPKLRKITPEDFSKVEESNRKHFPGIHLKLKDLPEARKWEIGKEYHLIMKVEQTSIEENNRGRATVGFNIKAVAPIKRNLEREFAEMSK